jgi:hypothetical protein
MANQIAGIVKVGKPPPGGADVLNSWKEIAGYLGRGVRTVQRWEVELALPVRRPGAAKRSAVIAMRREIDSWLSTSPGPVSDRNGPRGGIGADLDSDPDRADVVKSVPPLSAISDNLTEFKLVFRKSMDSFIRVEVETGCTFALVALSLGATRARRTFKAALRVYHTACRLFEKYGVSPDRHSEIVNRLADLRDLLGRERSSATDWCALPSDCRARAFRAIGSRPAPAVHPR